LAQVFPQEAEGARPCANRPHTRARACCAGVRRPLACHRAMPPSVTAERRVQSLLRDALTLRVAMNTKSGWRFSDRVSASSVLEAFGRLCGASAATGVDAEPLLCSAATTDLEGVDRVLLGLLRRPRAVLRWWRTHLRLFFYDDNLRSTVSACPRARDFAEVAAAGGCVFWSFWALVQILASLPQLVELCPPAARAALLLKAEDSLHGFSASRIAIPMDVAWLDDGPWCRTENASTIASLGCAMKSTAACLELGHVQEGWPLLELEARQNETAKWSRLPHRFPKAIESTIRTPWPIVGNVREVLLLNFEHRRYSQTWEDGVIEEIFRRIGATNSFFVEFGVESGHECNSRFLRAKYGFRGVLWDSKHWPIAAVNISRRLVLPSTVQADFSMAGVPHVFDLLSIDVDGGDYAVWESLVSFRPRVVVIEYFQHSALRTSSSRGIGATGAVSLARLGARKGYALVHLNRVNAFFVADEALSALKLPGPRQAFFKFQGDVVALCTQLRPHCGYPTFTKLEVAPGSFVL